MLDIASDSLNIILKITLISLSLFWHQTPVFNFWYMKTYFNVIFEYLLNDSKVFNSIQQET